MINTRKLSASSSSSWQFRSNSQTKAEEKERVRNRERREEMAQNGGAPLVVSFGEMLIDFVPDVAGVSLAESAGFVKAPGGAPANVSVAIAKLGGRSAFVGKVGEDEFGHMLVEILKQNGVDDSGVLFDRHARTALAFVTLRSDGEREFMFYRNPSADMLLTEAELDLDLIRRASIFHYGSISLITEPCRSAHIAAMRAAKAAGILCSYDPNVRLPLWPSRRAACDGIMGIWKEADFIKRDRDDCLCWNEKIASAVWIRKITEDLGINQDIPTTIYCDNASAIALSKNPSFHSRTKHIEIKYHFLRDLVANGQISLHHCCSDDQLADILTKPLFHERHAALRAKLGVLGFSPREAY